MSQKTGNGKHVLVTGGGGFIGSHLCERLLDRGYRVTAVDNFVTGRRDNLSEALKNPDFRLVEWDVSRELPLDRIEFLAQGLDGVLHFACPASPIDFDKIPFEILAVDSLGTFNTVDLAIQHRARYVIASTSEIYGDPLEHPQKESYFGNVNSIGPRACYDEAKRFGEAVVSTAARGVGSWKGNSGYGALNGGIVRIFNTYGPRMRPDDGRVVPELCMRALRGESLSVHGNGEQTRSFCYVDDLVEGIIRYFESSEKAPMNIGNPDERTILDFAKNVNEICRARGGSPQAIEHLPAREDDPKRRCPDIARARALLGWEPQVDLAEGLAKTYDFFKGSLGR
jgi:dTDP-glucose 4,6-dehydratase